MQDFNGKCEPGHVDRFRMYARKIQAIIALPSWDQDKMASHCIYRLLSLPDSLLFPAMKKINIGAALGDNEFIPFFHIYGALLTSIHLDVTTKNKSAASTFLVLLVDKASTIRELVLTGKILSCEILGFIKYFRRLRKVNFDFASGDFSVAATLLQDLGDLPDLHHLELCLDGSCQYLDNASLVNTSETHKFLALKTLVINGQNTDVLKMLGFVSNPPQLRSISCETWGDIDSLESIHPCIKAMCSVGRDVETFFFRSVVPNLSHHDLLQPLMQCRRLSSFTFQSGLSTDDEFILEHCKCGAWRNLSTLDLTPTSYYPAVVPSLTTLRILAQNCPNLNKLVIPIDFTLHTPSSLREEQQHPRTQHPLEHLRICRARRIDPPSDQDLSTQMAISVARFFEHYFPNLQSYYLQFYNDDEVNTKWRNTVETEFSRLRAEKGSVQEGS